MGDGRLSIADCRFSSFEFPVSIFQFQISSFKSLVSNFQFQISSFKSLVTSLAQDETATPPLDYVVSGAQLLTVTVK